MESPNLHLMSLCKYKNQSIDSGILEFRKLQVPISFGTTKTSLQVAGKIFLLNYVYVGTHTHE